MAQVDFILTDADRERLLRWTLAQQAIIVPDAHYRGARVSSVSAADELRELLSERQFWVMRRDWKVEDLVLHPVDNQDLGAGFRVSQRYGGPTISYLLYPEHTEHGNTVLGRGSVHHYPFYYSSVDNRKIIPSPEFKRFFKEVTRFVKTDAICLKGKQRSVWLTRAAAEAISSGRKHAPSEWKEAARRGLILS
jgi:hypothetical protein